MSGILEKNGMNEMNEPMSKPFNQINTAEIIFAHDFSADIPRNRRCELKQWNENHAIFWSINVTLIFRLSSTATSEME